MRLSSRERAGVSAADSRPVLTQTEFLRRPGYGVDGVGAVTLFLERLARTI